VNGDGSIRLTKAEALVLDAFFRRWHTGDYGDTLKIADDIERFCVINLSANVERIAWDDVLSDRYEERLREARDKLRRDHELTG
jgi:hypothetical protein